MTIIVTNARNFYIDALRTIAISLVTLLHAPANLTVLAILPSRH